jgi:hypothetical protein
MAYSTAFTSWLVVASNFFTSSASAGPKLATMFSRNALAAALSGGTSVTWGIAASVCAAARKQARPARAQHTALARTRAAHTAAAAQHARMRARIHARTHLQPADLHQHAVLDQRILAEDVAQACNLVAVAAAQQRRGRTGASGSASACAARGTLHMRPKPRKRTRPAA